MIYLLGVLALYILGSIIFFIIILYVGRSELTPHTLANQDMSYIPPLNPVKFIQKLHSYHYRFSYLRIALVFLTYYLLALTILYLYKRNIKRNPELYL